MPIIKGKETTMIGTKYRQKDRVICDKQNGKKYILSVVNESETKYPYNPKKRKLKTKFSYTLKGVRTKSVLLKINAYNFRGERFIEKILKNNLCDLYMLLPK